MARFVIDDLADAAERPVGDWRLQMVSHYRPRGLECLLSNRKAGAWDMSESAKNKTGTLPLAPPLAPIAVNDILQDADALLELMGKESLDVVADLANSLSVSAHQAGASEIEEAARNIGRLASGRGPVVLAGAMRALADAISRTERALAA